MFSDVSICFTNLNQPEVYKQQIIDHLIGFSRFTKPMNKKEDWRDDAVNTLLTLEPISEYIIFIEQDFLIKDHLFFRRILNSDYDFVYYLEDTRIHPAFILIKRDLLDKTSLDFSAHPPEHDHFGKVLKEIREHTKGASLEDLGLYKGEDFYHLGGTSQNYYCARNDQPLYKPDEFLVYNYHSMLLPNQINSFYKRSLEIYDKYGEPKDNFISSFFPKDKE